LKIIFLNVMFSFKKFKEIFREKIHLLKLFLIVY